MNQTQSYNAKETLNKLQSALMQMHRHLIQSLKSDQENQLGHPLSPVDWLQMMITFPNYAWLKKLTGLMSDFDALLDNFEVGDEEVKIIRQELEKLFLTPSNSPEDFYAKYVETLRRDSDVMIYHGQLRHLILALPLNTTSVDSTALRLSWHQKPRHRS